MSRYKQPYTLFKRGKYWYYRTYDARGVRTTAKSTGQTNKTAARDFCEHLYLNNTLTSCNMLFREYASDFLNDNSPFIKDRLVPLTPNTLTAYRGVLKNHLLPDIGPIKLANINYSFLKRYRVSLYESNKPATVRIILFVFKEIMQSAYRDNLLSNNPFTLLEPMKVIKETKDSFSREEVITIAQTIDTKYQGLIILCALSGMRLQEALGVRMSDVCKQGDIFYIHLEKQLQNGQYAPLKTKDERDIPIIEELKGCLWPEDVNCRKHSLYEALHKVIDKFPDSEKRKLSTHSLRHFFITDSKAKGINSAKVEKIAGHSLKGIENVYTNFKVEDLAEILSWQKELFQEMKLK